MKQDGLEELLANLSPEVTALNVEALGLAGTVPTTKARRGKYGAVPTEYNGATYPSKAEASKAQELDLLVKAGEIDFWLRQVPFPLGSGIIYRADFVLFKQCVDDDSLWGIRVVEVKGYDKRADWRMKFKMFKQMYPNLTLEVTK